MKKNIVFAIVALFLPLTSFAQTVAPNIPSTFGQYGFLHLNYSASNNDLGQFTSYTTTGFAESPSQVPLLVAAGFKNIIYITNFFAPSDSPVLAQLLTSQGIAPTSAVEATFDFRTIPDYESKALSLYRAQLVSLRDKLVANGTLDKVQTFYLADEPALHRNYVPNQAFLNQIDAIFESVFPGKLSVMAFAQDLSGANPFRGAHFNPPPTVDLVAMDPYFSDSTSVGCSEDSVRNFIYNTNPNAALNWAFQFNKPVYLIGDAMLRNGSPLQLCYPTNEFNIAKGDSRIKGLVWFIYDAANLDGGTYLSGAAGSPDLVNTIKNLTAPSSTSVPAVRDALAAPSSRAASLTQDQINSILGLLSAFNADSATIASVSTVLSGGTPTNVTTAPQTQAINPTAAPASTDTQQSCTSPQILMNGVCTTPKETSTIAPVVTLSPEATTIAYGSTATLKWSVTSATNVGATCVAAGGNLAAGTTINTTGSWTTPQLYTTTQYGIKCTNSNGLSSYAYSTVTVPAQTSVAAAPAITITSPTRMPIIYGGTAEVSWSASPSSGVACVAAGGDLASGLPIGTTGSWTTPRLYTTTQYGMQCTNTAGQSSYGYFTVDVQSPTVGAPTATLSQSSSSTASGAQYTVSLSSTNATSCVVKYINPDGSSGVLSNGPTSGTMPLSTTGTGTYTATATCTGSGGSVTSSPIQHTVTAPVSPAPKAALSQSSQSTVSGGSYSVSLSSTNATSCKVTYTGPDGGGTLSNGPTSGTLPFSTSIVGTYTATATCTGAGGSVTSSPIQHTVTAPTSTAPVPTATLSQSSSSTASGAQYSVSLSSTNVTSCVVTYTGPDGGGTLSNGPTSGSLTLTTSIVGTYTATATCSGSSGSVTSASIQHTVTSVLGSSIACVTLSANMHRGTESKTVSALQGFLQAKGLLMSSPTGFFGDKTVAAVKAYQMSKGLPVTGMVYGLTKAAIRTETCQ